jgi:hypothetical protein
MKPGPKRQLLQFKPGGRDILAKLSWSDNVSARAKLRKQFSGKEMNLTLVAEFNKPPCQKSVLHVRAGMDVPFDSVPFDERDAFQHLLAEPVPRVARNAQYFAIPVIH